MAHMTTKSHIVIEEENDSATEQEIKSEDSVESIDTDSNKESDSENESVLTNGESDGDSKIHAGWADSIAKILKTNKPKGKKTLVLSKAKKLADVKKKEITKEVEFELEDEGKVKEEKIKVDVKDEIDEQPLRKKKKELPKFRIKPNILEKDRERTLSKIATRGVVQLFNAVKTQQKDIENKLEEAGPLERKRDKVLNNIDKRTFLNVLMGQKSQTADQQPVAHKKERETNEKKTAASQPTWSVLRDDFMMSAKLKDWDKEMEVDEDEIDEISESE